MSSQTDLAAAGGNDRINPFDLDDDHAYRQWREHKLGTGPWDVDGLIVEIGDLAHPTPHEHAAIVERCRTTNMAIYTCADHVPPKSDADEQAIAQNLRKFTALFGLTETEAHRSASDRGVVALEVADTGTRKGYIPYTNRPLSWHTDGYYNAPDARIRSFVLHCVRDAAQGGENALLDPEMVYIALRDKDKQMVAALMHESAMIIPRNVEKDGSVRPDSIGPVFSVTAATSGPLSHALEMRYSARARNIIWRDDEDTLKAKQFLIDIMAGDDFIMRHRLQPGQGLICNNVLHNRSGFENGPDASRQRLYFRSRFTDAVTGT